MARAFLPSSAPFDAGQRAALDGVLADAGPVQRAWLAGFLAGLDAQASSGAAEAPQAAAPPAAPLTLLYATESGNSEALAHQFAKRARKLGFKPRVVDFATVDLGTLASAQNLLVIAATWGEGEPPGRAAAAYAALMGEGAPRLDGVRFGVLGLGDTSYAEFCAVGRAIDSRLEALGGVRAAERADCDLDYADQAAAWVEAALDRLRPAAAATAPASREHDAADAVASLDAVGEVIEHVNLNSSRSAKETIHLALAFPDNTPPYEPGDSLELFPQNDPAMVDRVLASAGLAGDDALRQSLLVERDVTTLSQVTVERFAQATGHVSVRAMVAEGQARAWADGRQLIDLLQTYPAALTADQLTSITRKLPPRAYSVASSRKDVGDEAHLLICAVRYQTHGQARTGVASVHVADRVRTGALLKVRLKRNPRFRLPADGAKDIIMVGPGTGVAPFRAFVQERRAAGAAGRSWLFFGDQRFTHDFLYQLEWQEALEDGSLTRIDVAFSRDQPEKVYVQDRIRQNRREFVDWLESGAHLYVCGDAKRMAKDVRRSVVDAYADVKALGAEAAEAAVRTLEAAGRYQQDVY